MITDAEQIRPVPVRMDTLWDQRDSSRAACSLLSWGGTYGEGRGHHRQQRTDWAGNLPSSGAIRHLAVGIDVGAEGVVGKRLGRHGIRGTPLHQE